MYQQCDGRRFSYSSPQDPANAAYCELAIVAWLQGDVELAETSINRALMHSDELGRPFDQAYATCHAAALRNLQRRFAQAAEHARKCIEISQTHGLVWAAYGALQLGVASASHQEAPDAAPMFSTLDALRGAGFRLNTPYFLWGRARGEARVGNHDGARNTVNEALQEADSTGEAWCNAELLLLAADLEVDPERARMYRRRALSAAESAGAPTVALRALLALDPCRPEIRDALDGMLPYPPEADWVHAALRELSGPAAMASA
jgi:tetratricopeptide (TPR) repeat protein